MKQLVILGAGGFGREVHDIVVAINERQPTWDFVGFADDHEPDSALLARRGCSWIGSMDGLSDQQGASFVVGVGEPAVRRRLALLATEAGLEPATLIHPTATLGLDVEIGSGSVICSHVSITTNIRIGSHVHVNLNCTVGHDVVLRDFVTVFPGSTISGNVLLEEGVMIGTNSAVIQGIRVGAGAFVGAGAVVVRDVSESLTVVGVPARPLAAII